MSPARQAAFKALETIEERGAFADIVLFQLINQKKLHPRDRSLMNELVRGVLRWQKRLDWIINSLFSGKPETLPLGARLALRMTLYQIMFLNRIPEFAAINEGVELAKHSTGNKWAGVCNGILRAYMRSGKSITYPDERHNPSEFLSVYYSHPKWMIARWLKRFGIEDTRALCKANNRVPPVSIRINKLNTTCENAEEWLHNEGIHFSRSEFIDNYFRAKGLVDIENHHGFLIGEFTVQDESAGLASLLLQPQPSNYMIDLCASPGGKASHSAELMQDKGTVIANDHDFTRLQLVKKTSQRLGLNSTYFVNADGCTLAMTPANRVLVDAPCSGLGVLARKPDLRWRRTENAIQDLVHLQTNLLNNAAKLVAKNGILVYSTCTIEPDENEDVVNYFLETHKEFVLEDSSKYIPSKLVDHHGFVRTFPHLHDIDGSFAARFRKK